MNRAFWPLDILLIPLLFMRFKNFLLMASCSSYAMVVINHFATFVTEKLIFFISPFPYSLLIRPCV